MIGDLAGLFGGDSDNEPFADDWGICYGRSKLTKQNKSQAQAPPASFWEKIRAVEGVSGTLECRDLPADFKFKEERDHGNCEYKWTLVDAVPDRLTHLATQMKFRLTEGHGIARYRLGVQDSGVPLGLPDADLVDTLAVICELAWTFGASVTIEDILMGRKGKIALVRLEAPPEVWNSGYCGISASYNKNTSNIPINKSNILQNSPFFNSFSSNSNNLKCSPTMPPLSPLNSPTLTPDPLHSNDEAFKLAALSVLFFGDGNAGKSSLMGVLLNEGLDDGEGLSRLTVMSHPHEVLSGRTSSVTTKFVCLDADDPNGNINSNNSSSTPPVISLCGAAQSLGTEKRRQSERPRRKSRSFGRKKKLEENNNNAEPTSCAEESGQSEHDEIIDDDDANNGVYQLQQQQQIQTPLSRVVCLTDVAGVDSLVKIALRGLIGTPHDQIVIVAPVHDLIGDAESSSNLRIALYVEMARVVLRNCLPVVVLTKIDTLPCSDGASRDQILQTATANLNLALSHLCPRNVKAKLLTNLNDSPAPPSYLGCGDSPLQLDSVTDIPLIPLSCVSGDGVSTLRTLLRRVSPRTAWRSRSKRMAGMVIEDIFRVNRRGSNSSSAPGACTNVNPVADALGVAGRSSILYNSLLSEDEISLQHHLNKQNNQQDFIQNEGRRDSKSVVILCGLLHSGTVSVGDVLLLGPFSKLSARLLAEHATGGHQVVKPNDENTKRELQPSLSTSSQVSEDDDSNMKVNEEEDQYWIPCAVQSIRAATQTSVSSSSSMSNSASALPKFKVWAGQRCSFGVMALVPEDSEKLLELTNTRHFNNLLFRSDENLKRAEEEDRGKLGDDVENDTASAAAAVAIEPIKVSAPDIVIHSVESSTEADSQRIRNSTNEDDFLLEWDRLSKKNKIVLQYTFNDLQSQMESSPSNRSNTRTTHKSACEVSILPISSFKSTNGVPLHLPFTVTTSSHNHRSEAQTDSTIPLRNLIFESEHKESNCACYLNKWMHAAIHVLLVRRLKIKPQFIINPNSKKSNAKPALPDLSRQFLESVFLAAAANRSRVASTASSTPVVNDPRFIEGHKRLHIPSSLPLHPGLLLVQPPTSAVSTTLALPAASPYFSCNVRLLSNNPQILQLLFDSTSSSNNQQNEFLAVVHAVRVRVSVVSAKEKFGRRALKHQQHQQSLGFCSAQNTPLPFNFQNMSSAANVSPSLPSPCFSPHPPAGSHIQLTLKMKETKEPIAIMPGMPIGLLKDGQHVVALGFVVADKK